MSVAEDLEDLLADPSPSSDGTAPEATSPAPGASCPECGDHFAGPVMVAYAALYRHLTREHGWSDEQLIAFREARTGKKVPKSKATKVKPDAVVSRGRGRPAATTKPKPRDDFERKVAEAQKAAAWITANLNPLLLQGAMMIGVPPFAVCEMSGNFPAVQVHPDRPTQIGRLLTLDPIEAQVFGFAYAYSADSWWADKLKDLLPKVAPPLAAVAVAAVTYRYAQRVKMVLGSAEMQAMQAQWESFKAQAAQAQAQQQTQAEAPAQGE